MFHRLPGRIELAVFALMAFSAAAVVTLVPRHDYAMMFAAMPLFLVSAIMGLRRNPQLNPRDPSPPNQQSEVSDQQSPP
jgi:hypothetical protein